MRKRTSNATSAARRNSIPAAPSSRFSPARTPRSTLPPCKARLDASRPGFVHEVPVCALSLSNLTESGAAYTAAEIAERADLGRAHGYVHLDGARFANALVSTGATPAELSWKAGVNLMSFGATKNGAIGCEAILLFGEARKFAPDLMARAKRAGHMPPKMRFLGAQMAAYLKDGLWLDLARRANASARTAGGRSGQGRRQARPSGRRQRSLLPPSRRRGRTPERSGRVFLSVAGRLPPLRLLVGDDGRRGRRGRESARLIHSIRKTTYFPGINGIRSNFTGPVSGISTLFWHLPLKVHPEKSPGRTGGKPRACVWKA